MVSPRTEPLHGLKEVALELGDEALVREARELAMRVDQGRFHVACVGQFKRGKSTLLNALVGSALLPTGVTPVTSAITVLRHGANPTARVHFSDGHVETVSPKDIGAYVSEAENPENRKHVQAVEVFSSSDLLASGLCLVDTPGLGSPLGGNAAVTRAFVPQIDAALVVLGADPPISGDELDLVAEIAQQLPNLVLVLNKADRLTDDERAEGRRFATELLARRLGRPVGGIFEVSATEVLQTGAPTRDWAALLQSLSSLAHESGAALVRGAANRGRNRIAAALLREIDERHDALVRPLTESEHRLAALRASIDAANRALGDLGVLLGAEGARLTASFRERQEAFLPTAVDAAHRDLERGIRALSCEKTQLRAEGFRIAQDVMRQSAERFRRELEPVAEDAYRRATERFVALANEFLARLAASREPGLETLPACVAAEAGFRAPSRLHYTELLYRTTSLAGWVADAIRPRRLAESSVLRRTRRYLDDILEANSSRIANDLAERVADSRAALEAELRNTLTRVTDIAERALAGARERRAEGALAVDRELRSLASLRNRITAASTSTEEEEPDDRDRIREGAPDPGLAWQPDG